MGSNILRRNPTLFFYAKPNKWKYKIEQGIFYMRNLINGNIFICLCVHMTK